MEIPDNQINTEYRSIVIRFGKLLRKIVRTIANLELRVWISHPKNGISNVKDAVFMAVWDSFHANGIEIAFPQRDLHIKDAVPLKILKDSAQPVEKDSKDVNGK
jgi:small-conductance mechanosensitive channel